jgi:hypothetical protein
LTLNWFDLSFVQWDNPICYQLKLSVFKCWWIRKNLCVLYVINIIITLLKINLFSPWYSWKVAELALNNNHSLKPKMMKFENWSVGRGATLTFYEFFDTLFVNETCHHRRFETCEKSNGFQIPVLSIALCIKLRQPSVIKIVLVWLKSAKISFDKKKISSFNVFFQRHDIAKILRKLALNTNQSIILFQCYHININIQCTYNYSWLIVRCPCHKPEINKIRSNFNYILHSGPLESLDDDKYQTTLLWLSHAWTWISNVICRDLFSYIQQVQVRGDY